MKVLFYGGCHAGVFRQIFERWGSGEHSYETLVNYELIASGRPFPLDWVLTFDAVVYSPIVSKHGYSTAELKAQCHAHNVRAICFPWLQWNGYFPSVAKQNLIGHDYWFPPRLLEADWPDDGAIKRNLVSTTERLQHHELESAVDIRVSDFILEHYQKHRLFVTPDHPSNILYRYVAREICKRLDISLHHDFFRHDVLLQPELVLPIPLSVSESLQLSFSDNFLSFRIGDLSFKLEPSEYNKVIDQISNDLVVLLAVKDATISSIFALENETTSLVNAGEAFIGRLSKGDGDAGDLCAAFISGRYFSEGNLVYHNLDRSDWRVIS